MPLIKTARLPYLGKICVDFKYPRIARLSVYTDYKSMRVQESSKLLLFAGFTN